jgi:enterochelin esterase family protein
MHARFLRRDRVFNTFSGVLALASLHLCQSCSSGSGESGGIGASVQPGGSGGAGGARATSSGGSGGGDSQGGGPSAASGGTTGGGGGAGGATTTTGTGGPSTGGSSTGGTSAGGTGGAGSNVDAAPEPGAPPASLPDPGAEGDGDFKVSDFTRPPELTDRGAPKGKTFQLSMPLADSKFYNGKEATVTKGANAARSITVYVPAQYKDGTAAPVLVMQDGPGLGLVGLALDNLTIAMDPARRIPAFVAISVQNGGGDSIGSERGLEYDTVSDRYARFIDTEVLPAVETNANIKAAYPNFKLTKDPSGRATYGCSSGGAAAFTMVWFRPDLFSRAIGYSATLVAQQNSAQKADAALYPHGAWDYHSDKEIIKNDTSGKEKVTRFFINANSNDNGATAAETGRHNWLMANQRTAAALKAKGFHYRFVEGLGAGHCAAPVKDGTLADALIWLWRGYQPSSM